MPRRPAERPPSAMIIKVAADSNALSLSFEDVGGVDAVRIIDVERKADAGAS